ncbi:MAG TPA: hypothetical protein DCW74_16900 [Alteromonas australica]|uniref:Uncharacterized protein n=1 Tax=Alteromonas australica TaxID=589873 RepID=A0A350P7Y1_9ALTE|nr:hypothetical protein [Alteromonas australica]
MPFFSNQTIYVSASLNELPQHPEEIDRFYTLFARQFPGQIVDIHGTMCSGHIEYSSKESMVEQGISAVKFAYEIYAEWTALSGKDHEFVCISMDLGETYKWQAANPGSRVRIRLVGEIVQFCDSASQNPDFSDSTSIILGPAMTALVLENQGEFVEFLEFPAKRFPKSLMDRAVHKIGIRSN